MRELALWSGPSLLKRHSPVCSDAAGFLLCVQGWGLAGMKPVMGSPWSEASAGERVQRLNPGALCG